MFKPTIQTLLVVLFAVLLACCITTLLVKETTPTGLTATIIAMGGCLIIAGVLPQIREITVGLKGISAKVAKQQKEIDTLKFLLTGYVTEFELTHLRKLRNREPFPFNKGDTFCEELRRLWRHGLIRKLRPDWYVGQLPAAGNLSDFLEITDRGAIFLRLLDQVENERTP
jgi:hypothetical protein